MHVVVTGASAGIGRGLARAFAGVGADLTLVARSADKLEALAAEVQTRTHVVPRDLSNAKTATDWLPDAVAALGPVDVLINNAGVQIIGPTAETDIDAAERLLVLDLHVPLRLTRAVLPSMIARKSGTIVDIASMASLAPTPGMTWYNAAKAGLAGASEALRGELRHDGVHVVTVYPGIIPTDMGTKGLAKYEKSRMLGLQPQGNVETLSRLVVRAVQKRKPRVIYPRFNVTARMFPGVTRWVMDRFTPPLAK